MRIIIDHPMLPLDLGRYVIAKWALGESTYAFNDLDFQALVDEDYEIVRRYGLPKPKPATGPLADVIRSIRAARCALSVLPDNLVNGVPEWN